MLAIVCIHTDYTRIDAWIERMKYWLNKGIDDIYFFMHMHNEATSPELTVYLVDKMNKECELNLIKPKFVNEKKTRAIYFRKFDKTLLWV